MTTVIHESERSDGNSLRPATSTQSGPTVYQATWSADRSSIEIDDQNRRTIQNTPKIAPHISEKNTVRPKVVVGSQKAKQLNPQTRVSKPAVSILLNRSLAIPIIGLPIAVPILRKPTISVPWAGDNPMERAKSDNENSKVIYPNMDMNAQSKSRITSYRRSSFVSKAS